MALVQYRNCEECNKEQMHFGGKCIYCKAQKEDKRVKDWEVLSIEQKLTDLRKRVETIERGPATY